MSDPSNDPTGFNNWILWPITGFIASGFSALKRSFTMTLTFQHVVLGTLLASTMPYIAFAIWPSLPAFFGIPIAAAIGLTVVGISVMIDKTNQRVATLDPTKFFPERYRPPPETEVPEVTKP